MASALKLKNDINKLKAALKSKATPKSFIPKLKSQLEKAEADYESVKAGKKSAPKASKQVKSTMDKLKAIIKKKKYGAYRAQGVDLEKDADRPALPTGKRISKNGNTYYEYRANRIDVKQPPKRYPKLEKGGYMALGGSIWEEIRDDFEDDGVTYIDAFTSSDDDDGGKVIAKVKSNGEVIYLDKRAKTDSYAQEVINEVKKRNKADGGYMADGGVMNEEKYKKRMKMFGYKPYGKTKGRYQIDYKIEGEKQTEIRTSLEEAQDAKKRYEKIGYTDVKITNVTDKMADGGTIDNSGMTPADLQNQIWNLTARIAKLGDIESRAASDEIEMLMKQRKKLQSMALSLGDMTMAQGGELHRSQEEKFKYGGYMAEGGILDWSNDENEALGNWLMKTKDGKSILSKSKNATELEDNVREYAKNHDGVAGLEIDNEDEGLEWVTFDDLMREIQSRYSKGGYMAEGGQIGRYKVIQDDKGYFEQGFYGVFDTKSKELIELFEFKKEADGYIKELNEKGISKADSSKFNGQLHKYKKGGYMAKGGALEHGLKKGDHIMVIRGNMLGIKNEITGDVVTLNIETGERKETKE